MPMPLEAGSSSQTFEDSERLLPPSSKTTILPHILLIVTQFFFSGWHLLGSLAMRGGANPLIFALYRESLATFLMFFYVLLQLKGKLETLRIDRDDIPRFVFVGFCCFVNVVGTVVSLQYISPDKYAILQPAIPVIATVISCCVKLENFTTLKVLGICIASLGAILIESESISEAGSTMSSNHRVGISIVLIQCVAAANMIVHQKRLLTKYDPAVTTFVYYSIATLFTMTLCTIVSYRFTAEEFIFNGDALPWIAVAYASVFATLFAYNATSWANKRLSPSMTTAYNTLQPFDTVLLSFVILSIVPSPSEMAGGLIIAAGLAVTVYGRCREEEDQYYSDYIPVYTTAVESAAIFTISTVPLDTSVDIQYSEYTDSDSALNSCEKGKSKSNNKSKGKNRVKGKSRRSGEPSSVSTPVAEMVPAEDADPAVDDGPH